MKLVGKFPVQKYRKVLSFRKFQCVLSIHVLVRIPEERRKSEDREEKILKLRRGRKRRRKIGK